jgi:flavin reductase (DIM6/NTAB) family NADH-FMN oxidoreductase RutF
LVDQRHFRDVMGTFATGVTVITTLESDVPYGITANSFTSVSLSPPLVMFCLGKSSTNFKFFMESDCFAVNILTEQQDSLSARFASYEGNRFEGVDWVTWETGAPILKNVVSAIDCRLEATHDAGDHIIMVGQVVRAEKQNDTEPLLYFQGGYKKLQKFE